MTRYPPCWLDTFLRTFASIMWVKHDIAAVAASTGENHSSRSELVACVADWRRSVAEGQAKNIFIIMLKERIGG